MTSPLTLSAQQQIDLLRAAAARIRELVAAATPGPWVSGRSWAGDNAVMSTTFNGHAVAVCGDDGPGGDVYPASADAAFIAAMHPGVGLVLADWLDVMANDHEANDWLPGVGLEQALILAQRIGGES